jgi:hypothetical protein
MEMLKNNMRATVDGACRGILSVLQFIHNISFLFLDAGSWKEK